jgi:hypothetical protein
LALGADPLQLRQPDTERPCLGSQRPDWHSPSGAWFREYQRFLEIDERHPALLRDEAAGVSSADLLAYVLVRNREAMPGGRSGTTWTHC